MTPKYRYWSEEYQQLCHVIYIDFMNRHIQVLLSADGEHEGLHDIYDINLEELEQWTGHTDANNDESYAGDVIQWDYKPTGSIPFTGVIVAGPKFEVSVDDWGIAHYSNGFAVKFLDGSGYRDIPDLFVIVNNRHQHPELLEEE